MITLQLWYVNTCTCTCVLIYVAFHVQGLEYWELWEGKVSRSSWESCMYSDLSQKHVVQWIPEGCQGETIDRLTILDWLLISIKLVLLNLLTHDSCQPTLTFTICYDSCCIDNGDSANICFPKNSVQVISQNKTRKRQTPQNIRCHLFLIILQMFDNNEFYFCNIYILRFGMLRQWSLKKNWLGWITGSELLWLPRITCTVAPIRPLRFVLPTKLF